MRKFILISALLLVSVSAQAGEYRNLSLTGAAVTAPEKPIAKVSMQLAQAATAPAETAAPVQAQTPTETLPAAATTTTATEPKPETQTTTATKTTETKPAKPAKTARREFDEHKARRIAARYGVYW